MLFIIVGGLVWSHDVTLDENEAEDDVIIDENEAEVNVITNHSYVITHLNI